jgi:teichuronic acid biosynthesis glycosyltransferase TuaG
LRAPASVTLRKIKYSNFIPCLTVIYDTSVLGKVYQPDIKKRNDYALWLRIFKLDVVKKAFCLNVVTAEYRSNTYGLSSKRSDLVQYYRRCLQEYGGYSVLESLLCVPIYLMIILFKKKLRGIYNKCVLFI